MICRTLRKIHTGLVDYSGVKVFVTAGTRSSLTFSPHYFTPQFFISNLIFHFRFPSHPTPRTPPCWFLVSGFRRQPKTGNPFPGSDEPDALTCGFPTPTTDTPPCLLPTSTTTDAGLCFRRSTSLIPLPVSELCRPTPFSPICWFLISTDRHTPSLLVSDFDACCPVSGGPISGGPAAPILASLWSCMHTSLFLSRPASRAFQLVLKMGGSSWPSQNELDRIRKMVAEMGRGDIEDVRVVVSPYRICPLGAHIDHQGGTVSAMTIDKGVLLGFIPSGDPQIFLHSGQFHGEVRLRVDEVQYPRQTIRQATAGLANESSKIQEECSWGNYVRGAVYALQRGGYHLTQGIVGLICGSEGLDSSGLSSSAAVGIAYLLALETANNLTISPTENIELDRLIENEYLGLRNGILDQSAILLSRHGCLTCMNCKTKEHMLVHAPKSHGNQETKGQEAYKILLAFSGLKQNLTTNPGYNSRVSECREAARILLQSSGNEKLEPLLCNVEPDAYKVHKNKLESNLARRTEHYFSENMRVSEGLKAWASGNLEEFGKLISASGQSSIENYECGCEPLIQLYEVLLRAPGVFGARFSGAGFRGCCIAFVKADRAMEAASFVRDEYCKLQPKLASQFSQDKVDNKVDKVVLVCEAGDGARVI